MLPPRVGGGGSAPVSGTDAATASGALLDIAGSDSLAKVGLRATSNPAHAQRIGTAGPYGMQTDLPGNLGTLLGTDVKGLEARRAADFTDRLSDALGQLKAPGGARIDIRPTDGAGLHLAPHLMSGTLGLGTSPAVDLDLSGDDAPETLMSGALRQLARIEGVEPALNATVTVTGAARRPDGATVITAARTGGALGDLVSGPGGITERFELVIGGDHATIQRTGLSGSVDCAASLRNG